MELERSIGARTGRRAIAPVIAAGDAGLRDLVRTMFEEKWLVLGVLASVLALAAAYLALAAPVYEARVVVQVEDTQRTVAGLEGLSSIFSEKRPAETEIAIMRSQSLLGQVVSQVGLDVQAKPEPRLLGRPGSGRIRVSHLSVPPDLVDRLLVLTALDGKRFKLATNDGIDLLAGEVGTPAGVFEGDRRLEITVAELEGGPGARFLVKRRDRGDVVDGLKSQLRIAETAKNTGIIVVALEGGDPAIVAAILNAFASTYLRQNVERKSAEAEKTLAFLDSQLPRLKEGLDRAEGALEAFQTKKGTVSLSRETEAMLDRSVDVERELSTLELERTELRQKFTDEHPSVQAIDQKIDQLRAKRSSVDVRMRGLPAAELESARLTRDTKVASQLYDVLLNKAQELRILRSGIVGNVRILDQARVPRRSSWPNRNIVLAVGLLLGLGGGVGAALARRALDEGAHDPEEIEARTGVPIYATIVHSDREAQLHREGRRTRQLRALATIAPDDIAVESLRSLRTALQFALVEAPNNVITIGSPSPGVGKSFVAVNLAFLLASAGSRVLLLDADLRRGRVHRYFGGRREPGLSDVVSGAVPLEEALRRTEEPGLEFLPTGRIPPNPAELLASQRFQQVMAALSPRYDYVLVDTPPALAVTDPTLVARCAGVNLLVLRSGQHPHREISLAVKQFTQNGFVVQGAILNDSRSTRHGYGKYGKYYEYKAEKPGRKPRA